MRCALPLVAFALGVGGCLVGTLDLDAGFACDTGSHPCTNGYSCVFAAGANIGTCVPMGAGPGGGSSGGGSTSGGSTSGGGSSSGGSNGGTTGSSPCSGAPTCAPGGGLLLCDGGVQSCGSGLACDYGKCVHACVSDPTCDAGVCDTSVNACVPASSCSTDGGACAIGTASGLCLAGVCTPTPPVGGSMGACTPGDGGGTMVFVEGPVAIFPNANAAPSLEDGGTVTFFSSTTTLVPVGITAAPGPVPYPSYSIPVPVGTWTALVQQPGVLVPTYFPGIQVLPPEVGTSATIPLDCAVEVGLLPEVAGPAPQPGHIYWVGRAISCDSLSYLSDYTVGLSPAPPALGYLAVVGDEVEVEASLTSSGTLGEFLAADAPYATTQYTLAINPGSGTVVLMSGIFTPPPYVAGQDIAVALTYPNFTQ